MRKKETIHQYLQRRLSESIGMHNRIAKETGVPQSTVNRVYKSDASPQLDTVQPLLDWFEKFDREQERQRKAKSAVRGAGNRVLVRGRGASAAAAALR